MSKTFTGHESKRIEKIAQNENLDQEILDVDLVEEVSDQGSFTAEESNSAAKDSFHERFISQNIKSIVKTLKNQVKKSRKSTLKTISTNGGPETTSVDFSRDASPCTINGPLSPFGLKPKHLKRKAAENVGSYESVLSRKKLVQDMEKSRTAVR